MPIQRHAVDSDTIKKVGTIDPSEKLIPIMPHYTAVHPKPLTLIFTAVPTQNIARFFDERVMM
jgi:hypothetical protein